MDVVETPVVVKNPCQDRGHHDGSRLLPAHGPILPFQGPTTEASRGGSAAPHGSRHPLIKRPGPGLCPKVTVPRGQGPGDRAQGTEPRGQSLGQEPEHAGDGDGALSSWSTLPESAQTWTPAADGLAWGGPDCCPTETHSKAPKAAGPAWGAADPDPPKLSPSALRGASRPDLAGQLGRVSYRTAPLSVQSAGAGRSKWPSGRAKGNEGQAGPPADGLGTPGSGNVRTGWPIWPNGWSKEAGPRADDGMEQVPAWNGRRWWHGSCSS